MAYYQNYTGNGNSGYSGGQQQTRSVFQNKGMERTLTQETFVSDESGKVTTNKVVLSCAPKGEPAGPTQPYNVMDQKSCALKIKLMPYQGNKGGAVSEFNISWPQAKLVTDVAEMAMIFPISSWDLADRWSKTTELERVFGAPLPPAEMMKKFPGKFSSQQQAQGFCRARILIMRRTVKRPDGQVQRLPWYIQIMNGYARKIEIANGGAYMERKSFIQENECHINVADGDMYSMFFWDWESIQSIMDAARPAVASAHEDRVARTKAWLSRQPGYQG